MKNVSKSSKILIVFLLFGFLFLQANPQMQGFASSDNIFENRIHTNSNAVYINHEYESPNINNEEENGDSSEKDGIGEDWMFGKNKSNFI